jgi:thiol-disulfide isomerase/thioredoxin
MTPEWAIRMFLAIGISLAGWALFHLVSRLNLRRVEAVAPRLDALEPGKAAIVYFTTPDCAACKSVQRPALVRLQQMMGNRLQIIEINAYENPDMAKTWGVMSVPTTFVLDLKGSPRQVNYGVTPAEKLFSQIQQG